MGQCRSAAESPYRVKLKHNLRAFKPTFDAMQLTMRDAELLYAVFCKIDADGSGEIDLLELLDYLDLRSTKFTKRAFTMFDDDGSGEIDFREFVVAMWQYCTSDKAGLTQFAFHLYDLDDSKTLDEDDIYELVKEVYGADHDHNKLARQVLGKIRRWFRQMSIEADKVVDTITYRQFYDFSVHHPALLFPAFRLQTELQQRVIGPSFWKRVSRKRHVQQLWSSAAEFREFMGSINESAFKQLAEEEEAAYEKELERHKKMPTVFAKPVRAEALPGLEMERSVAGNVAPKVGTATPRGGVRNNPDAPLVSLLANPAPGHSRKMKARPRGDAPVSFADVAEVLRFVPDKGERGVAVARGIRPAESRYVYLNDTRASTFGLDAEVPGVPAAPPKPSAASSVLRTSLPPGAPDPTKLAPGYDRYSKSAKAKSIAEAAEAEGTPDDAAHTASGEKTARGAARTGGLLRIESVDSMDAGAQSDTEVPLQRSRLTAAGARSPRMRCRPEFPDIDDGAGAGSEAGDSHSTAAATERNGSARSESDGLGEAALRKGMPRHLKARATNRQTGSARNLRTFGSRDKSTMRSAVQRTQSFRSAANRPGRTTSNVRQRTRAAALPTKLLEL